MPTLSENDRVIFDGQKATVLKVWKTKAKILTGGLEKLNVPIAELEPAIEVPPGQIPLLNLTEFEKQESGVRDWELDTDGEDYYYEPPIDEGENPETVTTESGFQVSPDAEMTRNLVIDREKFSPGDRVLHRGEVITVLDTDNEIAIFCERPPSKYFPTGMKEWVLRSDVVKIPEPSSITTPVIELSETAIAPDESSITTPVIGT